MRNNLELGGIAAQLALDFPSWIERRVEHVSYLDRGTTRWTVGLMFRWPEEGFLPERDPALESGEQEQPETIYVPLDLLSKRPTPGLDGIYPDGKPFPILPWARSASLAFQGITWLIQRKAEDAGKLELDPSTVKIVEAIVSSSPEYAEPLLNSTLDDSKVELTTLLEEHDSVRGLLEELATNVMLLAPAVYRPGQEEVWRYTYYKPVPEEPTQGQRAIERLRFADLEVKHPNLPLGRSRSYHFAADSPAELAISGAVMFGAYGSTAAQRMPREIATASGTQVVDLHARRPADAARSTRHGSSSARTPRSGHVPGSPAATIHLQAALDVAPSEADSSDGGEATLCFRLDPFGTFLSAVSLAFLTVLLLILATARLSELEGQTGAALLLALPGLTLGYLSRPGEHSFATRLLAGIRVAALTVGMCSFIVAGILAGGFIHHRSSSSGGIVCDASINDVKIRPTPHHTWETTADPDRLGMNCHPGAHKPGRTEVAGLTRGLAIAATAIAGLLTVWLVWGWSKAVRQRRRSLPTGESPSSNEGRLSTVDIARAGS